MQGAANQEGHGADNDAGLEDDGISLTWEIGRVVLIVVSVRRHSFVRRHSSRESPKAPTTSASFVARQVLSLVLGAAYFLGQLVDNQDPDEL